MQNSTRAQIWQTFLFTESLEFFKDSLTVEEGLGGQKSFLDGFVLSNMLSFP